jgi:hypothetical protein
MPFKPGQTGNPNGRPRKSVAERRDTKRNKARHKREMRGYLQKKFGEAGKEIIDAFADIAFSPKASTKERLAALQELANRGWGRPSALAAEQAEVAPLFTLSEEPSLEPEKVN